MSLSKHDAADKLKELLLRYEQLVDDLWNAGLAGCSLNGEMIAELNTLPIAAAKAIKDYEAEKEGTNG